MSRPETGGSVLTPGGEGSPLGAFVYQERQFNLLLVQAGLCYDHLETIGDAAETAAAVPFNGRISNRHDVISGALGASYPLTDKLTVAANIASGFRAPSIFELFANGVHGGVAAVQIGNPELDPERSLNVDLSLRWRSTNFSGSVTLYQNRIDDYIYLMDSGRQAANGLPVFLHEQSDAILQGLEAEASLDINEHWNLRLVLDIIDTENRSNGNVLPMTPANEILAELTWRPTAFFGLLVPYARIGLRHVTSQDATPGEPFQQFDRNPRFD